MSRLDALGDRVLVSGASGTVGARLVEILLAQGIVVCAFDHDEDGLFALRSRLSTPQSSKLRLFLGDVRDAERLRVASEGVDTVFHCAALKHVELSEYNPREAFKTNVDGTWNIIRSSVEAGVQRVILASSDKAVHPTGVMGATKLLAERLGIAANLSMGSHPTRISCVRFGNILMSRGSVLTIFQRQAAAGQPLTITSRQMTRFFISLADASALCLEAASLMRGGEIFVRDMGSADLVTLAEAFIGDQDFVVEEIGTLPGEKLYEELVTEEEVARTVELDGLFIVLPEWLKELTSEQISPYLPYLEAPRINSAIRSDSRTLSTHQLRQMIVDNGMNLT